MSKEDGAVKKQVPKYCEELLNVPYGRENNLKHVQLYGIVKACSSPKATHGTDYLTTVTLFDQTSERTMDVKIFHRSLRMHPRLRRVGDIIRIESLYTNSFYCNDKKKYAMGYQISLSRGGFVALYSHTSNEGEPYFVSSQSDREADDERLNSLIQFSKDPEVQNRLAASDDGANNYRRMISQIDSSMEFCDLVCKVLHVEDIVCDEGRNTVFFVWDSSDAKPQAWGREPETLRGLERIETPFSCVEKAPKFGSILPIVYSHPSIGAANVAATPSPKRIKTEAGQSGSISGSGEGGAGMMPMPDAGSWVKFRGLQPRVFEGQLQCFFVAFSTWTLHVEEGNILRMKKRTHNSWSEDVDQSNLTMICSDQNGLPYADDVPDDSDFYTIRQIIKAKEPARFRCLVRCYDTYPPTRTGANGAGSRIADISRKLEVPGGSNIVETHEYMFVLKLEDPTGSVDVVVRGDEAKLFLSQFQSPSDLEVNVAQRQMLQEKFDSLTRAPDEGGYSVPLMDCVIAKFLHAEEDGDDADDDPFDYLLVNTMLR